VVIAVACDIFREKGAEGLRDYCKVGGILYDVKYLLPAHAVDARLLAESATYGAGLDRANP
jgi:UDP-N-acetyl-D-galactosamine dehydrogenase